MSKVRFHSQGAALLGELQMPSEPNRGLPGVVVTGSWLTVKEQMPARYAALLRERGFAALTFDFKNFGASEGSPREVESPWSKAEDIVNAAAFLRSTPGIDPERVSILAVCASAGYAALALTAGARFSSAAFVAPWLHDAEIVRSLYGGDAAVRERMEAAEEARAAYARSGDVAYVPAVSNADPSAAMYAPGDVFDYYLNPARGAVPTWGARFATMAWTQWLTFDPIALAPRVSTPIRIVTSEQSATPGGARAFEAALGGSHDSVWIEGTQFDFYDHPEVTALAADRAIEHFRRTSAASSRAGRA